MPYVTHETHHFIGSDNDSVDMDLCDLLQTMKLDSRFDSRKPTEDAVHFALLPQSVTPPPSLQDELMLEVANYHSDAESESSISSSSSETQQLAVKPKEDEKRLYGCVYLQTIQAQLQAQGYPTTGGEYLDTIFTHREILFSYPAAHVHCARGLSDLAYELETRAWRADREADLEAVTAFRHEAWVIASQLLPQ
ncbi:hypothetical protein BDN70DRAFT_367228 [Pholiota conissans]|uniref:Uncharacterized protein n=1 Tax=Pholiota conissans TaxID=109636 RepID=A0A9P5ZG19_9AGAR|nr:hypothetical protein BDN70DRAFT_367228 [Pholiota conissans]